MPAFTVEQLKCHLGRRSPIQQVPAGGASSRVEDEYDHNALRDAPGYASVVCYIQQGLGGRMDAVRSVLGRISAFQKDSRLSYDLHLFSFGWPDGLRHAGDRPRQIPWSGMQFARDAKLLCDLAGTDACAPDRVVPSLYPESPYLGFTRGVQPGSLLVFFCRDRSVRIAESVRALYQKHRRRALWVFLGDDPPSLELGTFEPAVSPPSASDQGSLVRQAILQGEHASSAEDGAHADALGIASVEACRPSHANGKEQPVSKTTQSQFVFKRQFSSIAELQGTTLYKDFLRPDAVTDDVQVFPSVRDGRITFYHQGRRLVEFADGGVSDDDFVTNMKFASVLQHPSGVYTGTVRVGDLANCLPAAPYATQDAYNRVKENARHYADPEASGVAEIIRRNAYCAKDVGDYVVLDTEICFSTTDDNQDADAVQDGSETGLDILLGEAETGRGWHRDRIDMLLLECGTGRLRFCEVKRYGNRELRGDVAAQMSGYQRLLNDPAQRQVIVQQYVSYAQSLSGLLRLAKPIPTPVDIDQHVGLLIFGFDQDQERGGVKKIQQSLRNQGIKLYARGSLRNFGPADMATLWVNTKP